MLRNVNPLLTPDLLKYLSEMGHGDELVIADGNFPAASMAKKLVRVDGNGGCEMLDAILSVFPLDQYDENNCILMSVVPGDEKPEIWEDFQKTLYKYEPDAKLTFMERFTYYERAKNAYLIVATGEMAQYANIILKKGVCR